jgi:chaperonin GroEL
MQDEQVESIAARISKLRGGLAICNPGGSTEVEVSECRDRLEDAVCAAKAAIEQGFVPGGGLALIRASRGLEEVMAQGKD